MGRRHFCAYGYHATILDQVAEDAGFSRGALYGHFRDKPELLIAVFEHSISTQLYAPSEPPTKTARPPVGVAKLREMVMGPLADREWCVLRTELEVAALHSEVLRQYADGMAAREVEDMREVVQAAVESGVLSLRLPVDDFVLLMETFFAGLLLRNRESASAVQGRELCEVVETLCASFVADAPKRT